MTPHRRITSPSPRRKAYRPRLEDLDNRCLPSGIGAGPTGLLQTDPWAVPREIAHRDAHQAGMAPFRVSSRSTGRVHSLAVKPAHAAILHPVGHSGRSGERAVARPMGVAFNGPPGTVVTSFGAKNDGAQVAAVQSDGKIVVAGSTQGSSYAFALARYNPDGTLDASFGSGGKVITAFSTSVDMPSAIMIQPDGKIVATGYSRDPKTNSQRIAIARYNPNGTLDASFGNKGKVITAIGSYSDQVEAGLLQPDGKIVVVGTIVANNTRKYVAARFNSNGTLDTSFGSGGVASTIIPSGNAATSVAYQGGNLIVGGTSNDPIGGDDVTLVRFTAGGALDTSFGNRGLLVTKDYGSGPTVRLAVLGDGRIIAAASVTGDPNTGYDAVAVARYSPDGVLDTTFGNGGLAELSEPYGMGAAGVVIQGDGKIIVDGPADASPGGFVAARFNNDGTVDTSYGSGGAVLTPIGPTGSGARGAVLQGDGRLVVVGSARSGSYSDFALARYTTAGVLDTTF